MRWIPESKPLDGDFDIDQGLYFKISISAYPDPVVLKERVHEALYGHTDDVCIRRSCVTVFYHCDDEPIYHVDIAIYSDGEYNDDGKARTAKGKQYSAPEHRIWQISNPQALTDTIFARFEGADREQFRRIVRYLKRWKALNFPTEGNAAPNGIGLTVATYNDLQPAYTDRFANAHDDLRAMRSLIEAMLSRFIEEWDENEQQFVRRLVVRLPIEPCNDLFARMTANQMAAFEKKLIELKEALVYAEGVADPTAACERLQLVFGKDFPVPEKKDTATTHVAGDQLLWQQRVKMMETINRWRDQLLRAVEEARLLERPRRVQLPDHQQALEGRITIAGHRVTVALCVDPLFHNQLPVVLLRPSGTRWGLFHTLIRRA